MNWSLSLSLCEASLVQAFFHLHCVHHSSRCSMPYTFRHFLASPRGRRTGDFGEAPNGELEEEEEDVDDEEEEVPGATADGDAEGEEEEAAAAGLGLSLMYFPPLWWE